MVERIEYRIVGGSLVPKPEDGSSAGPGEASPLDRHDVVQAIVEGEAVTLRWYCLGRNWASLFFAHDWMAEFSGPYHLSYYLSGWFNETYRTLPEAADRLSELITKGDVHLSSTVYIQDGNPDRADIPAVLKTALNNNAADEAISIDCVFEPFSGKYKVGRVGKDSMIGKHYGMSPISYPCLTGHSYDQVVSRAYADVMKTGQPHYDHIYAAMAAPTGEVVWVPYQRVVVPLRGGRAKKGVRVVTEMTKVDVCPL